MRSAELRQSEGWHFDFCFLACHVLASKSREHQSKPVNANKAPARTPASGTKRSSVPEFLAAVAIASEDALVPENCVSEEANNVLDEMDGASDCAEFLAVAATL